MMKTEPSSSPKSTDEKEIKQISLKGHKGSVLCLAHSSSSIIPPKSKAKNESGGDPFICEVLLLSGSEDGTARLWDLRAGTRAIKCILAPQKEDVTSVAFYPATTPLNSDLYPTHDENNSISNYMVYLSCSSNVYGYDIRKTTSPIITEYEQNLSPHLQNEDEINQLSFIFAKHGNSPTPTAPCYISAADDSGQIRLMNVNYMSNQNSATNKVKVLQHSQSNNSAIVTNAIFQPKFRHIFNQNQKLILASGGTDCTVHLWDVLSRSSYKPSLSYQIEQDEQSSTSQVCNPPMVHSLSFAHSGTILGAGLGDGTSLIFRINEQQQQLKSHPQKSKKHSSSRNTKSKKNHDKIQLDPCLRLRGGHESSVACVLFPRFHMDDYGYVGSGDRLFCSAGNEGGIILWDLGEENVGNAALDPSSMFSSTCTKTLHANTDSDESTSEKILFGIPHNQKPNWLASSSRTQSGVFPSSLFVADTTDDITAYMMDMI